MAKIVARRKISVTEANKVWGNAADHARLFLGVAAVEHVSLHRFASEHETERPGGGNAQVVHGLTAEEFAQEEATPQAAGIARIGGWSAPLSCSVERLPERLHLTQVDGPSPPSCPAQLPN